MRTSIYLAVAFAILFISLSDAAVYKRQPGNGTPSGLGLAKPNISRMKTRSNTLRRREYYGENGVNGIVKDATSIAQGAVGGTASGGGTGGILGGTGGILGGNGVSSGIL